MSIEKLVRLGTGSFYKGTDNKKFQEVFIDIDSTSLVLEDSYIKPGSTNTILGSWLRDINYEFSDDLETRIFCKKGKLTLSFTGTNISLRIEIFSGWGNAEVYIDGVKPSMIPNVKNPVDVLNFSAGVAPWELSGGRERKELVLAENLIDGPHTLAMYFNNTNPDSGSGWCAINSFKIFNEGIKSVQKEGWVINTPDDLTYNHNMDAVSITNNTDSTILDVVIESSINTEVPIKGEAGEDFITKTIPFIDSGFTDEVKIRPLIEDDYRDKRYTISTNVMWNQKEDGPNTISSLIVDIPVKLSPDSLSISYRDTWYTGSDGPVGHETRYITDKANATASFTSFGDSLTIEVQKNYGWGKMSVMSDDVLIGIVDCHDEVGGGFFYAQTFTGLGDGEHNITIKKSEENTKFIVFLGCAWGVVTTYYRQKIELFWNYDLTYVPPFPVENLRIEGGKLVHDPIDKSKFDLSIPRDNRYVETTATYWRTPTQITSYFKGWTEVMEEYDLIIFEPGSQSHEDILRWKNLGIINLGYVSFGEEDGWNTTPWAQTPTQTPWIGDGLGPGGYASYYLKGGYNYGEQNECKFDKQRLYEEKACSKGRSEYYTQQGRCSQACGNDWREGYLAWTEGGKCGGGYTRENNWVRSGNTACINSDCPKYAPLHAGCPMYEQENVWGQDFSTMNVNFPDENSIWSSYYTNSAGTGWRDKLESYWLPKIFEEQTQYVEDLLFEDHRNDPGADINARGVMVNHPPMDIGFEPIVKRKSDGYLYTIHKDFGIDPAVGIIKFYLADTAPEMPSVGEVIEVTYYERGLNCDGVFMDTVDTVDVYPREDFGQGMIDNVAYLKGKWSDKIFCSNRGFSVLEGLAPYCEYVMFETFFSEYNWETKEYYKMGEDSLAWNEEIHKMLYNIKIQEQMEVIALNYCDNGEKGDELRQQIQEDSRNRGYIGWSSTILLNQPMHNDEVITPYSPTVTNSWQKIIEHKIGN